jgi:7,8-dihydropterin-6-yl-methyl-4-(beta-D-ribofuranosyl)aminobenzene 5'-phosphate synthase
MKITVLVDNNAGDGLAAEHGLSLWIEEGHRRFLFDTGQGSALRENAARLGIKVGQAGALILSHGHHDHTGGAPFVAQNNPSLRVYCHPCILLPCYRIQANRAAKRIQMPDDTKRWLEKIPEEQICWTGHPTLLSPTIGVTGYIPRETPYEDTGGPFFFDPEGRAANPIEDDQAMWINSPHGLIVIAGCCHAGIVNTLRHVQRISRTFRIRAIIGGFHLLHAAEDRLQRTMAALQSIMPDLIVPCHCTGERAIQELKDKFSNRVLVGCTGMQLDFSLEGEQSATFLNCTDGRSV